MKKNLAVAALLIVIAAGSYALGQQGSDDVDNGDTPANGDSPVTTPITSPIDENGGSPPAEEEAAVIEVSLVIDDRTGTVQTYPLSLESGSTALDALEQATTENGMTLVVQPSEFGSYIEQIGDVAADPESGDFWIWYINDSSANVAADQYQLGDGDEVTFRYGGDSE